MLTDDEVARIEAEGKRQEEADRLPLRLQVVKAMKKADEAKFGELRAEIAALRQQVADIEATCDQAVKWIGRFSEELVDAGGAHGDRTVALSNLRTLIAERNRLAGELDDTKREMEAVRRASRSIAFNAAATERNLATAESQVRQLTEHTAALAGELAEAKATIERQREYIAEQHKAIDALRSFPARAEQGQQTPPVRFSPVACPFCGEAEEETR